MDKRPIPEDVLKDAKGYYRLGEQELSDDEHRRLLLCRQTEYLRTIKNCVVYFLVVSAVSTLLGLLFLSAQ